MEAFPYLERKIAHNNRNWATVYLNLRKISEAVGHDIEGARKDGSNYAVPGRDIKDGG